MGGIAERGMGGNVLDALASDVDAAAIAKAFQIILAGLEHVGVPCLVCSRANFKAINAVVRKRKNS